MLPCPRIDEQQDETDNRDDAAAVEQHRGKDGPRVREEEGDGCHHHSYCDPRGQAERWASIHQKALSHCKAVLGKKHVIGPERSHPFPGGRANDTPMKPS